MASPNLANILDLYQRVLTVGTVEYFQKQAGMHAAGTLAAAGQLLIQGAAQPLLQNCRRVRRRDISARTGGYCQARHKVPTLLCRQVLGEITHQLRQVLGLEERSEPRVYVLDGSSVELEHSRELVRSYPPAQNQHGVSHWPVLRIVVVHEMETALAEAPQWGPMYGPQAVSEQGLAEKAMDQLQSQSVILGDRNFGILWVAYAAQQRGLGVVLRLTEARARKLFQGPISRAGHYRVEWQASRFDGGKHHRLPAQAAVADRLIAARVGRGKAKQWLYLFTTLSAPAEEIVALYGGRWNIETDLRSLKRTVRLHHMAVKSPTMLEKELLMAVCAYNLVRAVMCLAARKSRVDPRQLSFAGVLNVVDCAWHKLAAATTPAQMQRELNRVLKLAAQCTLPKRKPGRSYPRMLWRRQPGFPYRKGEN